MCAPVLTSAAAKRGAVEGTQLPVRPSTLSAFRSLSLPGRRRWESHRGQTRYVRADDVGLADRRCSAVRTVEGDGHLGKERREVVGERVSPSAPGPNDEFDGRDRREQLEDEACVSQTELSDGRPVPGRRD